MSREQGPRKGMRPPAIAAGRRQWLSMRWANGNGGGGMSREQGPRKGMRPPAIAAGRRQESFMSCGSGTEAAT
jgi:hypothetical protein